MRAMHLLKAVLFSGLLAASGLLGGEAVAQKRVALVIGNSNYINVRPLANPENDATAIAALFRDANFDVVDASNNLGGLEMRRLFRDFAEKSRGADIAVVYSPVTVSRSTASTTCCRSTPRSNAISTSRTKPSRSTASCACWNLPSGSA